MKLTETKLSSKQVYDGKILKLCVDKVSTPDGKTAEREIVRHSGGAAVLLVNQGKIALVKQFRYAYGEELYEIPAGKIDGNEEPETAALRELEEETGYRAEKIERLLEIYPSPGYTDEIINIFLVTQAKFAAQKLDEGEFLTASFFALDDVVKMIDEGKIRDAKTVAAVYKYLHIK